MGYDPQSRSFSMIKISCTMPQEGCVAVLQFRRHAERVASRGIPIWYLSRVGHTSFPPAFPEHAAALMVCRSFPRPTRRAMTPSSVVCFSHMPRCSGLSKRTAYGGCNPFAYRYVERHDNRCTSPRCALPTPRDGRLHHFCSHVLIQGNNRGVSST